MGMSTQIGTKVQEMSSFDRYERALKMLATLLDSSDPVTLAVACHDLGDFVTMHPLGKKQISKLGVKEKVMSLMSSNSSEHREVRREALLWCQKIMLNKWQDVDSGN